MNRRKHIAQYIGGTNGNNYVKITVLDGYTLYQYPMIQATLNNYVAGVYVLSATRVSDTEMIVYFNQAFSDAAVLAVDYTVN